MRSLWTSLALATAVLTGCSVNKIVPTTSSPGPAVAAQSIKGLLHGGQQALVGAQVYLYKIGTGGYQSASSSLLASPAITGTDGRFGIPNGSFSCNAGDQLYLYSLGGSPGSSNTNNPYAGLLAVLGDCSNLGNLPSTIQMNEETTVAAAWALAPFAADATHISTGSSTQAKLGLDNAVATALNLVPLQTGQAPAKSPSNSNATLPQDEINTLADILAACVNVSDSSYGSPNHNSSACSTLAADATADGTPGGTQPSDTATAAINIAHNPTVHVADLLLLATATSPFLNILSSANDWTIAINYNGGSLHGPLGLAVDSAGYIWVANSGAQCISQFQPSGTPGPEDGFTGNGVDPTNCGTGENGTFNQPNYIAFSPSGNIWLASYSSATELDFSPGLGYESYLSVAGNYTGGSVNSPTGIAFDTSGNAWIANGGYGANSITEFAGSSGSSYSGGGLDSSAGLAVDTSNHLWIGNNNANDISEFNISTLSFVGSGYSGGQAADAVAIDSGGNVWVANRNYSSVSELNSSGVAQIYYATGGGIDYPVGIAIDGQDHIWTANFSNNSISEFDSGGNALSEGSGFTGGMNQPQQLAIDPSGNVWVTSQNGNTLVEFVGAAAPVVTPLVSALQNNQLGQRP